MEMKFDTPQHYESDIQPVDYIVANNLDFFAGNVVKYITRHRKKNGADDIRKAIHYCQMILKYDYGIEFEDNKDELNK